MFNKTIIPNFITFLNLFCGFISIYFSFQQNFQYASLAVMIATIFDMLDGRIARLLGIYSSIGKELDSFSDLITFGIAPSFIFFNLVKNSYTKIPILIILIFSFIYVITATIRLAVYNAKTSEEEVIKSFTGMPSTFAGISIAVIFGFNFIPCYLDNWLSFHLKLQFPLLIYALIYLLYSFLMVSKFKYTKSTKRLLNFKNITNILYNVGFLIILVIALKYTLLLLVIIYTISPLFRRKKNA